MITVIKGRTNIARIIKLTSIANSEGVLGKQVLVIRPFNLDTLLPLDNIKLTNSSDENIVDLIANAEVILIDQVGLMIELLELVHLANLGKQIYYTERTIYENITYDC